MARVTVEDCLETVRNMYELVHVATQRARQIHKGSDLLIHSKNKAIVTALREIAAEKVKSDADLDGANNSRTDDDALPH